MLWQAMSAAETVEELCQRAEEALPCVCYAFFLIGLRVASDFLSMFIHSLYIFFTYSMLLLELDNFLNTEALLLEVVTSREKQQHIIKQLRESVEQHSRRRPFSSSALCSVKNGVHRRCIGDVVTAMRFDRVELSWDSMEEHMHRLNMTTIMSPGLIIANLPLCQYQKLPLCQYQKHNLPNSCTFYSATRTQLGAQCFAFYR